MKLSPHGLFTKIPHMDCCRNKFAVGLLAKSSLHGFLTKFSHSEAMLIFVVRRTILATSAIDIFTRLDRVHPSRPMDHVLRNFVVRWTTPAFLHCSQHTSKDNLFQDTNLISAPVCLVFTRHSMASLGTRRVGVQLWQWPA